MLACVPSPARANRPRGTDLEAIGEMCHEPGRGYRPDPALRSGAINDYAACMVLGPAGIGGVLALIIR